MGLAGPRGSQTVRTPLVILLVVPGLGVLFFVLRPDPDSSDTASSDPASDGPRDRTFGLEIRGGEMDPEEISVLEGERNTLPFQNGQPDRDTPARLRPRKGSAARRATTLAFEAKLTGRFEIEDHTSESRLGVLLVRPG